MLKRDLDSLWKLEEISWAQKAKENWLRLGDKNTRFFHSIANAKRRFNRIERIWVDGLEIHGQQHLKAASVQFYKDLYSDPICSRPFPAGIDFVSISPEDSASLVTPLTLEEIETVVKSCEGNKSPGPDGFSMEFFKRNWETVKHDVFRALFDFADNSSLPHCVNSTFVALIPKKDTVEEFRDLRPISLVGGIYKILSKLLASRLRRVIARVISEQQFAFVGGRQILDAVLIANELLDSRTRSNSPGLVFKLDIEKAFDHVNWECLLRVISKMGFDSKWTSWISACISSARFSILVNGEAAGYFGSTRGLRQGDSLSPLLFISVMEVLSRMLLMAQEEGLVSGFYMNPGNSGEKANHLFFADDSLVFCEASATQVTNLAAILICFECISGLKINFHKTEMFPVGDVPDAANLASLFGCSSASLPSTYLGLPFGSRGFTKKLWDPVIDSLGKRLQTWKARFLSFGGRLTLIKSVLSSLPVYFLSLFKAPSSVILALERIQNRFLWSGVSDSEKIHWINWNLVKTPRSLGGLGVQDLRSLNTALLCKWHWRFVVDRTAWWRRMIISKCGTGSSEWQPIWPFRSAGLSLWRWVVSFSPTFWSYGFIDPGGGMCAFWLNFWVRGVSLVRMFPRVAAAAQHLEALISNIATFTDRRVWNIQLRTRLRGRALEEWHNLLLYLASIPHDLLSEGPASICWSLRPDGCFSVSSLRQSLVANKFIGVTDFPSEVIWHPAAPPKIACFCWRVFFNKVPTIDNLQRKGLPHVNRCVLCYSNLETVEHLFLSCEFASLLWSLLSSKLSIHGPFSSSMKGFISGWKGLNCRSRFSPVMNVLFHAVFWSIWKERNDRIFRDSENPPGSILHSIWFKVGDWMSVSGAFAASDLLDWRRLVFDNG
ncbi:LINE-1 retrotransposable element ORF2 protein [Linum perenne]